MNRIGMKLLALTVAAAIGFTGYAESLGGLTVNGENTGMEISSSCEYDTITVNGELTISGAITVTAREVLIAEGDGATGKLTVTNGATLQVTATGDGSYHPFTVGHQGGNGELVVSGKSTVRADQLLVANQEDSRGKLTVGKFTVEDSTVEISGFFYTTRGFDYDGFDGSWSPATIILMPGAKLVANKFVRCGKSKTWVEFDGGQLLVDYLQSQDGGTLVFEGKESAIDYVCRSTDQFVILSGESFAGKMELRGEKGFRFTGTQGRRLPVVTALGKAKATDLLPAYAGELRILGNGAGLVQKCANQIGNKNVRLVLSDERTAETCFDLNGFDVEFASVTENCGFIRNSAADTATLTVGGDDGDLSIKALTRAIAVKKTGTGCLDLWGGENLAGLDVANGTVNLRSRKEGGYRHYRFTIDAINGQNPYLQIAELGLRDADLNVIHVAPDYRQAAFGDSSSATTKSLDELLNDTAFWTFNAGNNYVEVVRPVPTAVPYYTYATGGDHVHDRSPSSWTFKGSMDGTNWETLDAMTGFNPGNRMGLAVYSWVPTNFVARYSAVILNGPLSVNSNATLRVLSPGRLEVSAYENFGTVDFANGVTVALGGDADSTVLGTVTGTTSLEKRGSGSLSVLGDDAAYAGVAVDAGTLRLGTNGGVTQKYWRWRVKALRRWWYRTTGGNVNAAQRPNSIQLRELALYDKDGNQVNTRAAGTTVLSRFADGTNRFGNNGACATGIDTLLDANNASQWFQVVDDGTNWSEKDKPIAEPFADDESTWCGFTFKLPDSAKAVYSYNLKTHGDHTDRDPIVWDFSVSDNGTDWTVIEDHADDPLEFITRIGNDARMSWICFNCGKPMRFTDGLAVGDKTCYGADAEIQIGAGARLALPGAETVTGNIRIDATQSEAGTLSHFNAAESGTVDVISFTNFAGSEWALPFTCENVANAENLSNWTLKLNGIPSRRFLFEFRENRLWLIRKGFAIMVK